MSKETLCPACGFDLGFQPWDADSPSDEICPCCGIQFGYDDQAGGDFEKRKGLYGAWRRAWLLKGMEWFSASRKPPEGWDPKQQLRGAGYQTSAD